MDKLIPDEMVRLKKAAPGYGPLFKLLECFYFNTCIAGIFQLPFRKDSFGQ